MATIKAIEAGTVHQIQSGQVIVDLNSVVKELVENGIDAGATSIEVRFKNQGLDSIEVQDNGSGISSQNYESIALKHYTSKLSTYSDLTTLDTFGFRGEALSSLCALSRLTVTTCLQSDVPKGTKLEFETSGKLKGTSLVAAQKGTTVSVGNLFQNLPVRRRELERNIKREWAKVISLLNQYACIQTGVKFTVSQQPNKGKRIVLFSTKGNKTTRDNIVNVFGAKTMGALIALDMKLELEPTSGPSQRWSTQDNGDTKEIAVRGFISRPAHGEGRQTPDRQMFYVNGRPCGLPQFAKVVNEVYRSYNSSQSPFIFADIQLDTHLYDVNVSPDKRTVLLHDQGRMLDNLRDALTELFVKQDHRVPMSQYTAAKQTPFKKLTITRQDTPDSGNGRASRASTTDGGAPQVGGRDKENPGASEDEEEQIQVTQIKPSKHSASVKSLSRDAQGPNLITRWVRRKSDVQEDPKPVTKKAASVVSESSPSGKKESHISRAGEGDVSIVENEAAAEANAVTPDEPEQRYKRFQSRLADLKLLALPQPRLEQDKSHEEVSPVEQPIPAITQPSKPQDPGPLSFSCSRSPKRLSQEVATITIGDHTVTGIIGTPSKRVRRDNDLTDRNGSPNPVEAVTPSVPLPSFGSRLSQMFSASGATQAPVDAIAQVLTGKLNGTSDGESPQADDKPKDVSGFGDEKRADSDGEEGASSPIFVEQDEQESSPVSPGMEVGDEDDGEYFDEKEKKTQEDLRVKELMEIAEKAGKEPSADNQKRTQAFLKGGGKKKDSTQSLLQRLRVTEDSLRKSLKSWDTQRQDQATKKNNDNGPVNGLEAEDAEEKLSLIISKADFAKMKIVGQFNLGFVLAVRGGKQDATNSGSVQDDELFIIDQHASDEKFNFERLQASTVVQSQRLVRPKTLELTAVEEEIVIENQTALGTNGFIVRVDKSGNELVGSRCQLLSLPLSRETTFSLADLEELISLLGDHPTSSSSGSAATKINVPRPSKVRKMFAMRACRSSIMIGKALSQRQMEKVVRHMGEMEKPWNCPHGRPTMRHLCGLGGAWDERGWQEGDEFDRAGATTDWAAYVKGH